MQFPAAPLTAKNRHAAVCQLVPDLSAVLGNHATSGILDQQVNEPARVTGLSEKTARRINPTRGDCRIVRSADRLRLQSVQEVNSLRRVRCGGENRPLVVFQHLQPIVDVAGVVLANLRRDAQISTEKRGATRVYMSTRGADEVETVDTRKPSVSEMTKVPMRQKAAAFSGATGMTAPKNEGRAVKDGRSGGHRSARSEAKEDREGAAKAAWPRSLTVRGEVPPKELKESLSVRYLTWRQFE
jgi:hypothetical protein